MAKVKMSEDEMIEKLCESFNLSDKGEAELRAFTYEIKVRAITLAVSKERERIVKGVEKMEITKYRGFPLEADEKAVNETCRRVINLINTK